MTSSFGVHIGYFLVVVVLRSPIHANEPSEYNGMLYRVSGQLGPKPTRPNTNLAQN